MYAQLYKYVCMYVCMHVCRSIYVCAYRLEEITMYESKVDGATEYLSEERLRPAPAMTMRVGPIRCEE